MLLARVLATLSFLYGMSTLTTMEVEYSWTFVDFLFNSETERQMYLESNLFIPKNNIMTDVDIWNEGNGCKKVFVALAKFANGTPVTLATVTNQKRNGTTLLKPYPDWSWQAKCDGLYSVYRVKVDSCNRLWVLDSGVYEDSHIECPPQLVIFDLFTDKVIRRHRFPSSILSCNSNLITIVVDVRGGNCTDSVAYVADVAGFKKLVYDYPTDLSWEVRNDYYYPDPFKGHFTVNGIDLNFMDGIFGMALGPESAQKDRKLYFHSLASVHEFWVKTSVLRNMSAFANDTGAMREHFHVLHGTRQSQSTVEDMTESGILFYALVAENAVGMWNSSTPFNQQNLFIAEKDDDAMQFTSGLKVCGDELWILTNRIENFVNGIVPSNETNYRIICGKVDDLSRNAYLRN